MALLKTSEKENNKKELEVSVDKKVFDDACNNAYKRQVKKISVPGFRAGKAPRKIIEKMYGQEVFYEDAAQDVYGKALEDAVKESDLDVVSVESIETVKIGDGSDFVFKALCVLKPEVEIKNYKGLTATKEEIKIKSEDVNKRLESMRERGSRLITVEDRPAKKGDIVKLDFEGYVDGKPFEGGKAENHTLTLGSGQFIKGFEEQIEGVEKGKEFEVKVTFPKDYNAENLKGKDAVFKCKLNEIQLKELPKLDDEFAKDVSEYDTLKDLKDSIKKDLTKEAQENQKAIIEDQLVDELIKNLKGDIPQVMIDKRMDALMEQMKQRLASQGLKMEDYSKIMGKNETEFKAQFEEQATKQVKCRLALEKIANLEKIKLTNEDIEEEYKKLAKNYNTELKKIKQYITKDEIKEDLTVEKALDLVKQAANTQIKKEPANQKSETEKKTSKKATSAPNKKPKKANASEKKEEAKK